jgi:PTH1 family peptidyl-tRNA hydrolase
VDWLVVGLGNPGSDYERTRHNIGFEIARVLVDRWQLPKPRTRFRGLLTEGRAGVGGAGVGGAGVGRAGVAGGVRVAVLLPQTYMNDAGQSVGPARGELGVPLDRVLVLHDEIDLPFGEIRVRLGGGLAGHNGLKSIRQGLGSPDFRRVRVGVGRPDTTDPDRVAAYVLGRYDEPAADVRALVEAAADAAERVLLDAGESAPAAPPPGA